MRRQFLFLIFLSVVYYCPAQDTVSIANRGVIRIIKPRIEPYIVVRYDFNLLATKKKNGKANASITPVKFFDTTGHYRVLTPKIKLSDFFVKKLDYNFPIADTPRVDSLQAIFIVNGQGKLKSAFAENGGQNNKILEEKFVSLVNSYTEWEKGYKIFQPGGVTRKKTFFRNEKFYPRDFNIEATVVFSTFPQTADQWKTGRKYDVNE